MDACRFKCQTRIFSEGMLIITTTFKYTRYIKINILVPGRGNYLPACFKPTVNFYKNRKFKVLVAASSLATEPRLSRPSIPKLTIGHDSELLPLTFHIRLYASYQLCQLYILIQNGIVVSFSNTTLLPLCCLHCRKLVCYLD